MSQHIFVGGESLARRGYKSISHGPMGCSQHTDHLARNDLGPSYGELICPSRLALLHMFARGELWEINELSREVTTCTPAR